MAGLPLYQRNLDAFGENQRRPDPLLYHSAVGSEAQAPSGHSVVKFRNVRNLPHRGPRRSNLAFFGRAAPLSAKSARFCVFREIAILTIPLVIAAALPFSFLAAGLPLYQRNLDVFGENQTRSDPLLYHSAVGSEAHAPKWALRGEIPQCGKFAP